eukprot:g21971.t1
MSKPSQRNATVSSPPTALLPIALLPTAARSKRPRQTTPNLSSFEEEELALLVEQVNKAKQPAELRAVCQKLLRGLVGARAIAETFQGFADRSDCDRCQLYACKGLACSEWRHPEETSGCPCGHTANSD